MQIDLPQVTTPAAEVCGERLDRVLRLRGMWPALLAQHLGVQLSTIARWINGERPQPAYFVALGLALRSDARWLATGKVSRAAQAALDCFERAHGELGRVLPSGCHAHLRDNLLILPEPAGDVVGLCRYCQCTNADGCEWLDEEATICSACLEDP